MTSQVAHSANLHLELGDPFPSSLLDLAGEDDSMQTSYSQDNDLSAAETYPDEPFFELSDQEDEVETSFMDTALPDIDVDAHWPVYDHAADMWTPVSPSGPASLRLGTARNSTSSSQRNILPPSIRSTTQTTSNSNGTYQLDLSPHSFRSFKRSFDQATAGTPLEVPSRAPDFASLFQHTSLQSRTLPAPPRSSISSAASTLSVPMPEQAAATTSAHRHSPPTPSSLARVKRRRSGRTGEVGTSVSSPTNESRHLPAPRPTMEVLSPTTRSDTITGPTSRTSAGHPSGTLTDWRFPSISSFSEGTSEPAGSLQQASTEQTPLGRYIAQLLEQEQEEEAENAASRAGVVRNSAATGSSTIGNSTRGRSIRNAETVLSRRGNNDFSLGSLPRFDFASAEDDDLLSPMSLFPTSSTSSAIRPQRTSAWRRPNLHRNATAVSPPEESPLNTPAAPATQDLASLAAGESSFFNGRRNRSEQPRLPWDPVEEQSRADSLLEDLERTRSILAEVDSFGSDHASADSTSSTPSLPETSTLPPISLETPALIPRLEPFTWQTDIDAPLEQTRNSQLWGELHIPELPPLDRQSASRQPPSRIPTLRRRPGGLGTGEMRGPTRASNEAWLRSQGIDFYDSLAESQPQRSEPLLPELPTMRRRVVTAPIADTSLGVRSDESVHTSRPRSLRRVPRRSFEHEAANSARAHSTLFGRQEPAPRSVSSPTQPLARLSRQQSTLWDRLENLQQQIASTTTSSTAATSSTSSAWRPLPLRPSSGSSTFSPRDAADYRQAISRAPPRTRVASSTATPAADDSTPESGILAVRDRLDNVRQLLDGLENNGRELRGSSNSAATALNRPDATASSRPPPSLARYFSAPRTSRTGPSSHSLPATRRPVLQPFDEIYAEVEAEFAGRPVQRARGTRLRSLSPSRSLADLLDDDEDAPTTHSQASFPDRTDARSQGAHGTRREFHNLPELDELALTPFDWLDDDGASYSMDDPVPLPPFMLRSLRARLQAHNQPMRGSGIASEAGNYIDDVELDVSYEGLLALSERIGQVKPRGASEAALAAGLVKYQYSRATSSSTTLVVADSRCGICLEDYAENDNCSRSRLCGHALHTECFEYWLKQNDSCPICRQTAV